MQNNRQDMIKILFVCHGNICRSPMAEFVMKELVHKAGSAGDFYIESAATSSEELGNGVYPPVKSLLKAHGIDCSQKTARRITVEDYRKFDLIIGMDNANMRNMRNFWGSDPDDKLRMLLSYCGSSREVADPWYTGEFETTWRDVLAGCTKLLEACGY